ncbi:MAG: O-antigen ligase family protein [Acidobacteriia bacterium]|nr:O-antigen ligase family protein [Terriglobia bacterium]
MKPAAMALAGLLFYAVLTLSVEERWAWSAFQIGIFALAGWRAMQPYGFRVPAALAPLALATAWPHIQLALGTSFCRGETWNAALNWGTFFLVFALAGEILSESGTRRWFLGAISLFGMLLAAVSTLQKYSSGGRVFWIFPSGFKDDVLGPFVNRNQYAAWVELLLPVALYLAVTDRRLRPLFGSAAAVMFGSVIASASRAGFVLVCGEVVAVMVTLAAHRSAPRKALALAAIQFVALVFIAVAVAGWQGLLIRLEAGQPEIVRVDALRASGLMLRDRPWVGSGLGTWSRMYPRYESFDTGVVVNQAHNDWAQWAAEGGLPFVLLLAIFALLLCKPAVQSIYGVGTVAFLLHALVDYPMQQRPAVAAWFFAVAGATLAWQRGRNRNV